MQRRVEVTLSDFRVFETDEFTKQLKKLPAPEAVFLRKKLNSYVYPQLKTEPFWGKNIKKLRGYAPDTWRYRIGNFRIFYIVDQNNRIISIITVDDRKDAYKK